MTIKSSEILTINEFTDMPAAITDTSTNTVMSPATTLARDVLTAREQGGTAYQTLLGFPCPPSLDLKFFDQQTYTNGYDPDLFAFNRATIATRVNHLGLIEEVGSRELRHDYNPDTREYLGILIVHVCKQKSCLSR